METEYKGFTIWMNIIDNTTHWTATVKFGHGSQDEFVEDHRIKPFEQRIERFDGGALALGHDVLVNAKNVLDDFIAKSSD